MRSSVLFLLIVLLFSSCQKVTAIDSDDVMYSIVTDRFRDGDPSNNDDVNLGDLKKRHGGDFKGILLELDYLQELGIDILWISPVQKNVADGYHGYWIDDFYAIEPSFGTMDELKNLVKEAHNRDIKVVFDYVVNHAGYNTSMIEDETMKDWFHPPKEILNYSDKKLVIEGSLAGLPDFDLDNTEVREYFVENALWLIEETEVDGFRLDTVKHVEDSFWVYFTEKIKEKYPDFYFLGEVYDPTAIVTNYYKTLGIDHILNYPLYHKILESFLPDGNLQSLKSFIKSDKYQNSIDGSFIDNHDNPRFLTLAQGERASLLQSLTFIMSYPQIPVIYYGTEQWLEGSEDPDNRRDFNWEKGADDALLEHWSLLQKLRDEKGFSEANYELLELGEDVFGAKLILEEKTIIILMNLRKRVEYLSFEHGELKYYSNEKRTLPSDEEILLGSKEIRIFVESEE